MINNNMSNYTEIVEHYENCLDKHGDCYKGVDWPNETDTLKRYKVMLDLIHNNENCTLLDFGCGCSHLYTHILNNQQLYNNIKYSGSDLSKKFCDLSKKKYNNINYYHCDVLKDNNLPNFDYIIMNGVFTEKRDIPNDDMYEYLCKVITVLFNKANNGIAFNVMSPVVDWYDDKLFYLSIDKIIKFCSNNLSRHVVIRHDYGLYEYTIYVYKTSNSE